MQSCIYSNMDGPGDYHTKWSKSDKRKMDIIWYHLYMESEKKYKWAYLQNRNRPTHIENKVTVIEK